MREGSLVFDAISYTKKHVQSDWLDTEENQDIVGLVGGVVLLPSLAGNSVISGVAFPSSMAPIFSFSSMLRVIRLIKMDGGGMEQTSAHFSSSEDY